ITAALFSYPTLFRSAVQDGGLVVDADVAEMAIALPGQDELDPLVEAMGAEPPQVGTGERHPDEAPAQRLDPGDGDRVRAVGGPVILNDRRSCARLRGKHCLTI